MLTTSPLPMLGVSSQVHARRATFGGCGCQGASVGASGSTTETTSGSESSTTSLAVGLIAGAVLLLLIAAA